MEYLLVLALDDRKLREGKAFSWRAVHLPCKEWPHIETVERRYLGTVVVRSRKNSLWRQHTRKNTEGAIPVAHVDHPVLHRASD